MTSEVIDDLLPYVICLLPCPLVVWCWRQWRRQSATGGSASRRLLTLASLVLGMSSCLALVIFPGVLHWLESARSPMADNWYIRSVPLGFFGALGSFVSCLFAAGRLRALLATTSLLLVGIWFMVGDAY